MNLFLYMKLNIIVNLTNKSNAISDMFSYEFVNTYFCFLNMECLLQNYYFNYFIYKKNDKRN